MINDITRTGIIEGVKHAVDFEYVTAEDLDKVWKLLWTVREALYHVDIRPIVGKPEIVHFSDQRAAIEAMTDIVWNIKTDLSIGKGLEEIYN